MTQVLLASPVVCIALFLVLYISDFFLTMHASRLYRNGASQVITLEGSYELNPMFMSDVERLASISPRFILLLALYSFLIWALWLISIRLLPVPEIFAFGVGAILLVQGPVHLRHVRNIMAFKHAKERDGITGQIEYKRRFSYLASAVELLAFSAIYLALALLSRSWMILGGAFACAVVATGHYRLSRRQRATPKAL